MLPDISVNYLLIKSQSEHLGISGEDYSNLWYISWKEITSSDTVLEI